MLPYSDGIKCKRNRETKKVEYLMLSRMIGKSGELFKP